MINYIKSVNTIEFEFIGGDNNNATMEEVIALVESKFLIHNDNDGTETTSTCKMAYLEEENKDLREHVSELESEKEDLEYENKNLEEKLEQIEDEQSYG